MTLNLTFAVSLLLGVFGVATMFMAQGHNRTLRKAAPIVGLTAQFAWGWFAWLLGPAAGGLWILVALYAGVYLHGIWIHWEGRRWLWRRVGRRFLSHLNRCMDCGAWLTADERHYYGHTCNRCEGIAMEQMEEAS